MAEAGRSISKRETSETVTVTTAVSATVDIFETLLSTTCAISDAKVELFVAAVKLTESCTAKATGAKGGGEDGGGTAGGGRKGDGGNNGGGGGCCGV